MLKVNTLIICPLSMSLLFCCHHSSPPPHASIHCIIIAAQVIDGGKYKSLEELVDATVPKGIRLPKVRKIG